MDLRDPWFSSWNSTWRRRSLRAQLHRRLFLKHAGAASMIVANTERLRAYLEREVAGHIPVRCVPNGVTAGMAGDTDEAPQRFALGHFGQVPGRRSERPLLEGLRRWLDETPGTAGRTSVRFFGGGSPEGRLLREALELQSQVSYEPRVPRSTVPSLMAQQYVLLLLANDQPLQVPGKAFEYVAAGRRILATTERESATFDALAGLPGCAIANTPADVARSLQQFWEEFASGASARVERDEVLRRMSYEARAIEYARLLDKVVESGGDGIAAPTSRS